MPTIKQKIAVKELGVNGGNISKAMIKAKYSNRKGKIRTDKLTKTKGFKELMDKSLPDSILLKVHREGLGASKKVFKNNNESGEIEMVSEEPDYFARHKYLESAYKIKGKYNDAAININLDNRRIIVTRGESGLVPKPTNGVAQTSPEPVGELPVQDTSGREEGA